MFEIFDTFGLILHAAPMFWFAIILFFNLMCFIMFGIDKRAAVKHGMRTPEALLIACSLLVSATGSFIGMIAFNHKTAKPLFYLTVPVLAVLQILVVVLSYC